VLKNPTVSGIIGQFVEKIYRGKGQKISRSLSDAYRKGALF